MESFTGVYPTAEKGKRHIVAGTLIGVAALAAGGFLLWMYGRDSRGLNDCRRRSSRWGCEVDPAWLPGRRRGRLLGVVHGVDPVPGHDPDGSLGLDDDAEGLEADLGLPHVLGRFDYACLVEVLV
jgi:hypothetical protein